MLNDSPFSTPLETTRLQLRLHTPDDADRLFAIYSQPDVARLLLDEPWSKEDTARHLGERLTKIDLDGENGSVAVAIEHNGVMIGDVTLWFVDRQRRVAEIGWVFDPPSGGQGFAAEAVQAVLELAFDRYRAHRVAAQMDARNTSSARLAERVGMKREAHLRQDWWNKGEWTDTLIYAMLGTDR